MSKYTKVARIVFKGDASEYGKTLSSMRRKNEQLEASLREIRNTAAVSFAAFGAATFGVLKFWGDFQRQVLVTEKNLEMMGESTDFTIEQLKQLAGEFQDTTTYGDDQILQASTYLIRVGGATQETYRRMMTAATDLAAFNGRKLQRVAKSLAISFDDPVEGLLRLQGLQIAFSKEQEEQIRIYARAGNKAAALNMMLEQIERRVGGTSQAMALGWAGTMDIIANNLGDFTKLIGQVLEDALLPIATKIKEITKWLATKGETVAFVIAKFLLFGTVASGLVLTMSTLGLGFVAVRKLILLMATAAGVARVKMALMWGAATLGVSALLTFLPEIIKWLDKFVILKDIRTLWNNMGDAGEHVMMKIRVAVARFLVAFTNGIAKLPLIGSKIVNEATQRELESGLRRLEGKLAASSARMHSIIETGRSGPSEDDQGTEPVQVDANSGPVVDGAVSGSDGGRAARLQKLRDENAMRLLELKHFGDRKLQLLKEEERLLQRERAAARVIDATERKLLMDGIATDRKILNQKFAKLEDEQTEKERQEQEKRRRQAIDAARQKFEDRLRLEEEQRQAAQDAALRAHGNAALGFEMTDEEFEMARQALTERLQTEADILREHAINKLTEENRIREQRLLDEQRYGERVAAIRAHYNSREVREFQQATSRLASLHNHRWGLLGAIGKAASLVDIYMKTKRDAAITYGQVFAFLSPMMGPAAAGPATIAAASIIAAGVSRAKEIMGMQAGGMIAGDPSYGDRYVRALQAGEVVVPNNGKDFDALRRGIVDQEANRDGDDREPVEVKVDISLDDNAIGIITARQSLEAGINV